ncbi:MAG TPA: FHA domain-containing protein [Candidatus Thermoplasmatota archaeon]|nr:FHA domain-containing protein [Candidatus Thermoplasmatota archaeon]
MPRAPPQPPTPPRWDLDFEGLARDLAPLGSGTRLRLLNYLTSPRYLEEIAGFLEMNRNAAKKHVDQLVGSGVVSKAPAQRDEGLVVEYRIVPEKLFEVFDAMRALGTLRPLGVAPDDLARTKAVVAGARDRTAENSAPRLVVVYGVDLGAAHRLESGNAWSIGREKGCGIQLINDPFASSRHAQIERRAGGFEITDLFSRNGTLLDWDRLPPGQAMPLANGQVVGIGKTLLLFRDR